MVSWKPRDKIQDSLVKSKRSIVVAWNIGDIQACNLLYAFSQISRFRNQISRFFFGKVLGPQDLGVSEAGRSVLAPPLIIFSMLWGKSVLNHC